MYNSPGISIALIFVTVGIGFKLSLAPSHQWTPDVYERVRDYECNRSICRQKDHPKMIISWLLRTNQIRWFYFSIFLTCSYGTKVEKIEKNQSFTTTDEGFLEKLRIKKEVRNPLFDSDFPTPVVGFLSATSKVAASASATRIFDIHFYFSSNEWHLLLEILAILSMILGNLIAITQTSMKRMLAYSSIGQIGYVIIGIIVGDSNGGYASMITYMLFYISINLGTFACIVLFGLRTGTDNIRDYAGLYTKDHFLALSLALRLLSLGGLPPLARPLFLGFNRNPYERCFYLLLSKNNQIDIIFMEYDSLARCLGGEMVDTRDSKSRAKERGAVAYCFMEQRSKIWKKQVFPQLYHPVMEYDSLSRCLGGEMVDTRDSKSRAKERGGSSPLQGIILRMLIELE
ncbi:hypothetical protein GOBAR_DD35944 [Gossypium barbadense]|nr:hypothetical protein GOBAR_DD35944 [Gossypium barbadense]